MLQASVLNLRLKGCHSAFCTAKSFYACVSVCVRRDVATIELSKTGRNWVRVSSRRGRDRGGGGNWACLAHVDTLCMSTASNDTEQGDRLQGTKETTTTTTENKMKKMGQKFYSTLCVCVWVLALLMARWHANGFYISEKANKTREQERSGVHPQLGTATWQQMENNCSKNKKNEA